VGLVARVIEARGIPTLLVSTGRDLTEQVLPPRSVFVNFPMGNPFGRAGDVAMQRRVLRDALHVAETATRGGTIVDLPYAWGEDFSASVDRTLGAMSPS
jgi:D-proline reductase (dithiol) PrdB